MEVGGQLFLHSSVRHLCLSEWNNSARIRRILGKFFIDFLLKYVGTSHFGLKSDKNNILNMKTYVGLWFTSRRLRGQYSKVAIALDCVDPFLQFLMCLGYEADETFFFCVQHGRAYLNARILNLSFWNFKYEI
jgi:hypothetical protein